MNFFENAHEGKNHWLRYVAVLAIAYIAAQIPSIIYIVGLVVKKMSEGNFSPEQLSSLINLNSQTGFVVLMLSFVFWFGLTWLLFKPFHKREPMTMISGDRRFRADRFLGAAGVYFIFLLIFWALLAIARPDAFTFHFCATKFFIGLLLALIFVPFQTGCEELIMRGYLMQGFGLCTKSKIWALVIVTIMFALLHSNNNEVSDFGFLRAMVVYLTGSAVFGFFTVLNDGIEFSWGIHFAHNFTAFTLFAVEGNEYGSSPLFTITKDFASETLLLVSAAEILIAVALYFIFRKKFGWNIREAFDSRQLKAVCEGKLTTESDFA
ncbi:MAG: CPBP family intramembrane metalloprotease [Salinivirgaceae bacterium]|nr:CPBP family intramembrane metalloprotease [Salinivirgaceae bacterium]